MAVKKTVISLSAVFVILFALWLLVNSSLITSPMLFNALAFVIAFFIGAAIWILFTALLSVFRR